MGSWRRFGTLALLFTALGLQGCSEGGVGGTGGTVLPPDGSETMVALAPAETDQAYAQYMRDSLALWGGLEASSDILEQSVRSPFPVTAIELDAAPDGGFVALGEDSSAAFNSTNLIVENVDEFDAAKYDGRHLYLANNQTLTVLETRDSGTAETLAQLRLVDSDEFSHLSGLYLSDSADLVVALRGNNVFVTDAFSILPYYGTSETTADFVDVTDPSTPVRDAQVVVEGSLIESRRVDNLLMLVTQFTPTLEGYQAFPSDDETRDGNERALIQATLEDFTPAYTINGVSQPLINPEDCLLPNDEFDSLEYPSLTTLAVFDLQTRSLVHATCLADGVRSVHMTPESLYLVAPGRDGNNDPYDLTAVHKFSLSGNSYQYSGTGELNGSFWGDPAFLMAEVDGRFAAITTETVDSEERFLHRLTILGSDARGEVLETIGTIPNENRPERIGKPGEQIFASRFFGQRAYVVTFEQIDPVYAIDLSTPGDPRIIGELEIPGFSSYLHPISEELLLGVGSNTETIDGFLVNDGVNVRLFEVDQEGDVQLLDENVFGRRWSFTPVAFDYKAFTILDSVGSDVRFALPVTRYGDHLSDEEVAQSLSVPWSDTSLHLYSIDLSNPSLGYQGALVAEDHSTGERFQPGCCGWGMRSFFNEDNVLFLSRSRLHLSDWNNLSTSSNHFIETLFSSSDEVCIQENAQLVAPEPFPTAPLQVNAYDQHTGEYLADAVIVTSPEVLGAGSYLVTVEVPGYESQTLEDVRIQSDGCRIGTTYIGVYLDPAIEQ